VAEALVIVPRPRLDAALDRDLLALPEVAPADLGEAVPSSDYNQQYSPPATWRTCMPAYGYVRQSRSDDDSPSQSPLVQEERIRAIAHGRDPGIVVLPPDLNVSGGKAMAERPSFAELLAAIESGECTAVYAYDLSRLFRNLKEQIVFFEMTEARKIPVRFVEGQITEVSGPTGNLLLAVVGAMNQWQREITSVKIRESLARIERETGRRNGNRPYGSKADEDAGAVVAAFKEAGSYDAAARLLHQRGVPTRGKKEDGVGWWYGTTVRDIIRREAPDLVQPNAGRGSQAGSHTFRLSRLLRCSTCGTFMTGQRDKRSGVTNYYCRLARVTPHARGNVLESKVLPIVADEAERFVIQITQRHRGSADDESRLRKLAAKRSRVVDMYADEIIDKPERDRRLAAIAVDESKLSAVRLVRHITFPPDVRTGDPAKVNAFLRRILASATVDMSQPAVFGPSTWAPTIGFEWRDESMRMTDEEYAEPA
jgi:DNA invertase Pin-like site-specific DNA recombinase